MPRDDQTGGGGTPSFLGGTRSTGPGARPGGSAAPIGNRGTDNSGLVTNPGEARSSAAPRGRNEMGTGPGGWPPELP